ncbi:MAG: chalcone isomerase family protein [Bacteroidetes bacterium]|nr:chalcone isomerase family protein [Bacteroidota bacterium]
MKKIIFGTIILFLSFLSSEAQTKINNIAFPDTYIAGKEKLVLNGGGTRVKYWMDMYVGALYIPAKSKDAASIVLANSPMVIRICIVSGLITSSRMAEAVEEGFKKSTGGKQADYKDKIEKFEKAFSEEIKKGDVFDIVYANEKISVYKNNTLKAEVEGLDFKKVVFGIWLGNDPADSDLKEGMLGKSN